MSKLTKQWVVSFFLNYINLAILYPKTAVASILLLVVLCVTWPLYFELWLLGWLVNYIMYLTIIPFRKTYDTCTALLNEATTNNRRLS